MGMADHAGLSVSHHRTLTGVKPSMSQDKLLDTPAKNLMPAGNGSVDEPPLIPLWPCLQAYLAAMAISWVVSAILFFASAFLSLKTDSGLASAVELFLSTAAVFGADFPLLALILLPVYAVCMKLWQRRFARKRVFYVGMILFNIAISLLCEGVLNLIFPGNHFPHLTAVHAVLAALAGALGARLGWSILSKRQFESKGLN
jgi:hypothetical protein